MDTLFQLLGAASVIVGGLIAHHFFNSDRVTQRLLDRTRRSVLDGLDAYNAVASQMKPSSGRDRGRNIKG